MNRQMKLMTLLIIGTVLAGCVSTTKEIARRTKSDRADVFREVPAGESAPAGFVDLVVKASVKTPDEGRNAPESAKEHGCLFLLNIDGQAVLWRGEGRKEAVPLYGKGHTNRDPEAGDGMKYRLEKRVRLAVGPHKVFFGLPARDYLAEFKISLQEGDGQLLEFTPRYRFIEHPVRMPVFRTSFLRGIERYDAVLNGQAVPAVVSDYGSYGFTAFLPNF
jgi:hypothetical protein